MMRLGAGKEREIERQKERKKNQLYMETPCIFILHKYTFAGDKEITARILYKYFTKPLTVTLTLMHAEVISVNKPNKEQDVLCSSASKENPC